MTYRDRESSTVLQFKLVLAAALTVFLLVAGIVGFNCVVGHNNSQNFQIVQPVSGEVWVRDTPGYYYKGFASVWTYPRTLEAAYTDDKDGDHSSMKVTFNDAGTALVSAFVKVRLPVDVNHRRLLHQEFQGNPDNIRVAIRAHLNNVIGASGPVMSASENQSSRKAEFNHLVESQLAKGLFKMRRTEIELSDLTEIEDAGFDAQGNKLTREKKARVMATEVVSDKEGRSIIIQQSPLLNYGVEIVQFSITDMEYDAKTLEQFAAKKKSYLAAEGAKAQRQEEVQQRLMVEEKGRRQVAEIEAEENQKKARALIQAQQQQEVAVIDKTRAVTQAQQKTEVADQLRREAESLKEIARIKAQTAELDKAATISLAEGQQKAIELGGGISDEKRVLAEIDAKARVGIAEALSKVNVPGVVIAGGAGEGNMTGNLMNLLLLRSMGVIEDKSSPFHNTSVKK